MAFPDDVFPAEDCCEICGVRLGDEIVIQEFADGSLVRLCPECAAGAALEEQQRTPAEPSGIVWPEEPAVTSEVQSIDSDPLERTRELLMPVTDLIALQGEMQSTLEHLAASLEQFATEMISETQGKTAVETRLQILERELDETRARLREAEASLTAATGQDTGIEAVPAARADTPAVVSDAIVEDLESAPGPEPAPVSDRVGGDAAEPSVTFAEPDVLPTPEHILVPPPGGEASPGMPGEVQAPASGAGEEPPNFRIEEVQAAQRYYNESPFIDRVRDVRRSLGRPNANLTRVPGMEPQAIVTVAWDIVWYQYLIDLRRDLPSGSERVVLYREGMDLDELAYYFKEKNAVINDDGRLDASELEVRLLSDPSALITEMSPEERQLLEDATEEIWDQRVAPEFKWDD